MNSTSVSEIVTAALKEDLGTDLSLSNDISSQLLPENYEKVAVVFTRELGVFCGKEFVDEVFRQLGNSVEISWYVKDGDLIHPGQKLMKASGSARVIMAADRTVVNFMQTLSGVATTTSHYAKAIEGTSCRLIDTRKTVPGIREALKYAVSCGGGECGRTNLYDSFLIKHSHIEACGGIEAAVKKARSFADSKSIKIEVAELDELDEALSSGADTILLDNFDVLSIKKAVEKNNHRAKIEVSGNVTLETIRTFAAAGADYISVGAITKNIRTLDMSMRFECEEDEE